MKTYFVEYVKPQFQNFMFQPGFNIFEVQKMHQSATQYNWGITHVFVGSQKARGYSFVSNDESQFTNSKRGVFQLLFTR